MYLAGKPDGSRHDNCHRPFEARRHCGQNLERRGFQGDRTRPVDRSIVIRCPS